MKRPLALVGFTYLLAQAAAVFWGTEAALLLAILFAGLFIASVLWKKTRRDQAVPIACCTAAIALAVFCGAQQLFVAPTTQWNGTDAQASGLICEPPSRSDGRYYYVLQLDHINGEKLSRPVKIRLSNTHALNAKEYDRLTGNVHFYQLPEGDGLDSRSYYQAKGIHLFAFLYEYEGVQISKGEDRPLYYYALRIRREVQTALSRTLPPRQAGMVSSVLLGDKQAIAEETKEDFRQIGVSHLLAVSGLHLSMIAQSVLLIFSLLRVPKRMSAFLTVPIMIAFMAITGFSASVLRAGVMWILLLLGKTLRREADSLNSLGASVLFLTIINPFAAGDTGFLLSVCATLGLILFSPKLMEWLTRSIHSLRWGRRFVLALGGIFVTTISASLFTLPILLITFRQFSLISLVANLLLLYPAMWMLLCAAIGVALFFAGPLHFLCMPFVLVAGIMANYLEGCARVLSSVPFASIPIAQKFLLLWAAGTLFLIAIAIWKGWTHKIQRITALLSCIILLVGIFSHQITNQNNLTVAILDSGDGVSVVLHYQGHAAVLSCGGDRGTSQVVETYLEQLGVDQLDYVLLPGTDREYAEGAADVIAQYSPKVLYLPQKAQEKEALLRSAAKADCAYLFSGQIQSNLWNRVEVTAYTNGNQGWIFLQLGELRIAINPLDLDLPENNKSVHFYITSSSSPGAKISCEYTVFSVSRQTASQGLQMNSCTENGTPQGTGGLGALIIEQSKVGTITVRREW